MIGLAIYLNGNPESINLRSITTAAVPTLAGIGLLVNLRFGWHLACFAATSTTVMVFEAARAAIMDSTQYSEGAWFEEYLLYIVLLTLVMTLIIGTLYFLNTPTQKGRFSITLVEQIAVVICGIIIPLLI